MNEACYSPQEIRVYVREDLFSERLLILPQLHYLLHVRRIQKGQILIAFNGRHGAWSVKVLEIHRHRIEAKVLQLVQEQKNLQGPHIVLSAFKKLPLAVEKATELGVSCISVLSTQRSSGFVKKSRLESIIIETCEQCRRTCLPQLRLLDSLSIFLEQSQQTIYWLNEMETETPFETLFLEHLSAGDKKIDLSDVLFLIGPEGGFSEKDVEQILNYGKIYSVSLGDLILRSETAVCSILSIVKVLMSLQNFPKR